MNVGYCYTYTSLGSQSVQTLELVLSRYLALDPPIQQFNLDIGSGPRPTKPLRSLLLTCRLLVSW
jgi:hypothetical protein